LEPALSASLLRPFRRTLCTHAPFPVGRAIGSYCRCSTDPAESPALWTPLVYGLHPRGLCRPSLTWTARSAGCRRRRWAAAAGRGSRPSRRSCF